MLKGNEIEYIEAELKKFEFNRATIGYEAIRNGLMIAIQEPTLLYNLKRKFYNRIAKNMNLDSKRIKWNIDRAINQMYLNTNTKIIMTYFSLNENEKITPKLFFMTIIDKFIIK